MFFCIDYKNYKNFGLFGSILVDLATFVAFILWKGKAAVARTSSPTVSPFSLVYLTVSSVIFVFVLITKITKK